MDIIELKSKILNDDYTEYVYNSFDIQNRDMSIVNIAYNLNEIHTFDWNIGLIIGNSGSGKTTILKKIGKIRNVIFDLEKPLISNFNWLEPKEATHLLTSMGLSSVPTWLRPFNTLSNGEQYRARLAYLVGSSSDNEIILIDEYTSVVDRDVAKAMSYAIQKYIRRNNKRIILASCHFDIIDWLLPDWTYSPQGGSIARADLLRQRPNIELQVSRVKSSTWNFFKKHHYLSEKSNKSYIYLLFEWNKKPVGISVIGRHIGRNNVEKSFRGSRIVVLPDYQGMGIGSKISEFSAGIIKNIGGKYYTKTINPALGEYRNKQINKWKPTAFNGKTRISKGHSIVYKNLKERASYCHEYIGNSIDGYNDLLLTIEQLKNINNLNQLKLF
jgi:energy-coupling factor transporter ATP-binding protein EcfA2/ribosomal protein S18 acetylase RimI-like enzyme